MWIVRILLYDDDMRFWCLNRHNAVFPMTSLLRLIFDDEVVMFLSQEKKRRRKKEEVKLSSD